MAEKSEMQKVLNLAKVAKIDNSNSTYQRNIDRGKSTNIKTGKTDKLPSYK